MGNREIQAAFKARMQERGFIQANEWIPASKRDSFKEFAKALRDGRPDVSEVTSNQPSDSEAIAKYYQTSKAKDPESALARAVRAYVAAEVEPQIEDEVKRRVAKKQEELKKLEADLTRLWREAARDQERASELLKNLDGLMTEEEYKLIRGCLHPDRADEALKEKFGKAFHIFSRLEKSVKRDMPVALRRKNGWS